MFTHDCEKKGHKLEARYDLVLPAHMSETMLDEIMCLARDVEELKNKIYVHDVCTKCGLTISRNSNSNVSNTKPEEEQDYYVLEQKEETGPSENLRARA